MNKTNWIAGATLLGMALLPHGAAGAEEAMHAGHEHHQHAQAAPQPGAPPRLADIALTDQNGRPQRLLSDVIGDKVVLVSFVYTHCTVVCPVVSHTFSQLQDQLGGLFGSRVRLVSLTVDPARDTPGQLKAYAAQHGARPGWVWLTGSPANVTAALKGFGTYSANFENHPAVVMLGDGRSGKWTRLYDIDDAPRLLAKTLEYLAAREPQPLLTVSAQPN